MNNAELHAAVLAVLAPVTRTRFTYVGAQRRATVVNATGIDLHDGRVDDVALDDYGRAEPYMGLQTHPLMDVHGRMSGGASSATFDFSLTLASGSPAGVRWALDRVRPRFSRTRLGPRTGFVVPYLDVTDVEEDRDTTPVRWFAPLRYRVSVH